MTGRRYRKESPMKEKKLSRRHARQALLLLWGGIALVLLGTLLRSDLCYIAGVLVLLAAVLYARKVNQCPYCGGITQTSNNLQVKCEYCGRMIDVEKK